VTVTLDLQTLKGAGGEADFDLVGPITAETARFVACDASVSRIVLNAKSEPLDVGRRTPVVPAPLRRAVVTRDRHCRFPGCDRPHAWCDAHHIVHWADGGATSLANLILLCRRYHRLIHGGGFRVFVNEGSPEFRRPDESILHGLPAP
jgi:hypothetical protein